MQAQTLALACVAALYPVGLLAVSLLLSTDRPLRLGLSFYAGAATSLFVVGTLVITVLHGAGVSSSSSGGTRGGFRMGLGTAMLAAAFIISRRARRPATSEEKKEPSWKKRLRGATPAAVFFTGAVLYSPSGSYLASMQQIATSKGGWPAVLQLVIVISIVLLTVELPLLAYGLRPQATARTLARAEGWIDRHGRQALMFVLVVLGSYLFVDGIVTIVS